MLALYKQVKVIKCQKFGDLILTNCDIIDVFKNKKYPEIVKENVWEFAWDRGWEGIPCPPNAKF